MGITNIGDEKMQMLLDSREQRISQFVNEVFDNFIKVCPESYEYEASSIKAIIRLFSVLKDKNRPILDHVERAEEQALLNRVNVSGATKVRYYDIKVFNELNKNSIADFLIRVLYGYKVLSTRDFEVPSAYFMKSELKKLRTQCRKIRLYLEKDSNQNLLKEVDIALLSRTSSLSSLGLIEFLLIYSELICELNGYLGASESFKYHEHFVRNLRSQKLSVKNLSYNNAANDFYKKYGPDCFHRHQPRELFKMALSSLKHSVTEQLKGKSSTAMYQAQSGVFTALFLKNNSEKINFNSVFVQSILYDLNFVFKGCFIEVVRTHKRERKSKFYDQKELVSLVFDACRYEYIEGADKFARLVKKSSETVQKRVGTYKAQILSWENLSEIAKKFWNY